MTTLTSHGTSPGSSPGSSPEASPGTDAGRTGPSGIVQAVGRRPADIQRRRGESLAVLAVFTVLYTAIGHWLVVDLHVVGFETLDRWTRALMVSTNDPPQLAAIGVDYPPLAVLLLVPFAVVPSLTASLAVVPVVSALSGALVMTSVNTMMRRALVALPVRLAVLVALGLNPLVVMYAAIGARDLVWLAFVMMALGALLAWYVTADIRFVMIAGVAFAAGSLAGYGSLVWFAVSLVMVAAVLARLGADRPEIEGTTVGLAAPTVYAVAVWSAFNLVLLAEPLGWLSGNRDVAAPGGFAELSALEVVRGTSELVLHGAPIAIVVLPALLLTGLVRRNVLALWLGVMLLASILAPGFAVVAGLTDTPLHLQGALPILLVAVVGGVWLARSALHDTAPVAGALALGLLVSIPWTFSSMQTFPRQGLERAFHDAVSTGESQEGVRTLDGSYVGYDLEQQAADYITDHVDATGSILTDDASTYAVILLTGAPDLFLDRVDRSDEGWRDAAASLEGVRYLLLGADPARDELSRRYPTAAAGDDPALRAVFSNDRYTLVAVPDAFRDRDLLPDPAGTDAPDPADPAGDEGGVGGVVGQPADAADLSDLSDLSDPDNQSGATP